MQDLIFKDSEFGELGLLVENDKVYFPATQCAKILGYSNPYDAIKRHCKSEGVVKREGVSYTTNQHSTTTQQITEIKYISEGNLYRLIASSKLPTAEKFESWIFDEVLPTIHKTGGYVSNDELFIETYLPYADENTKNLFRLQLNTITQLNHKIEKDKPLVDFAEQVSNTDDLIDIGALSKLLRKKGLNIGRNKLFEWLRNNKFLRSNNEPYQMYINQGYFKTKESTYFVGNEPKITIKTFVTGKGQQYIFNKLSNANIE